MTITNYTDRELQLQAEVAELKADNENLLAYAKHERSLGAEAFAMENLDLTQQIEILKAKLAEYERRYPKSAAETHPMIPNSKCKCEHWQRCPECTPTLKGTP